MSRPTLTAISRLRKVIGYLKTTSDFYMVLGKPIGGQGKWKSSERFSVGETFSDSDWSGNKQHRRSTSCGVHTLNGEFLFASSRTQRVVSLSSCESELHSMISALCDGIYLRRCIEFLTGCQVEHHLLVDSSSARQVAMRQGPGRLKHVSGRLTTHFQHQNSTHFQHRLTPNTKNSLPTPKINSLPTQKALFGVEGESTFRFPIGTEASLLEPHHKQTLQGK